MIDPNKAYTDTRAWERRQVDTNSKAFQVARDALIDERMLDVDGWWREGFTETDLIRRLYEAWIDQDANLSQALINDLVLEYCTPSDDEVLDSMGEK